MRAREKKEPKIPHLTGASRLSFYIKFIRIWLSEIFEQNSSFWPTVRQIAAEKKSESMYWALLRDYVLFLARTGALVAVYMPVSFYGHFGLQKVLPTLPK